LRQSFDRTPAKLKDYILTTALIEINDSSVDVSIDGASVVSSPGYAVLDGSHLLIGETAQKNARLLPRWTNTRFWQQLDTSPLAAPGSNIRHHADLVLQHLETIWQSIETPVDEAVLAIPGDYSTDQLGLLLGIIREARIPVVGLVDSALVAAAGQPHQQCLYLDIHLHRITLSHLATDGNIRRSSTSTVIETGLFTLWDRWADIIASQLIQTSRYDPMHKAASEQLLYDRIPSWIAQRDSQPDQAFGLEHDGIHHGVSVSDNLLLNACSNVYPAVIQAVRAVIKSPGARLLISHRFAGFPGLTDSLSLLRGVSVERLTPDTVSLGMSRHLDRLRSDRNQVAYITSLRMENVKSHGDKTTTAQSDQTSAATNQQKVTHLLLGSHAWPIGAVLNVAGIDSNQLLDDRQRPRFTIYPRGQQTFVEVSADTGVTLNQQPIDGQVLVNSGDIIALDGQSLTLISSG
jgi:hypothetical protein